MHGVRRPGVTNWVMPKTSTNFPFADRNKI